MINVWRTRGSLQLLATALVFNLASAITMGGCSSESNDQPYVPSPGNNAAGGSSGNNSGVATGAIGARCNTDSDCLTAGARCLTPGLAGSEKFCANACQTTNDCNELNDTSYLLEVPTTVTPQGGDPKATLYGTQYLSRGIGCLPATTDGPSFCRFGCPDKAAITIDADGKPSGCSCLPGYRINAEKSGCEPNPDIQCTILSYATEEQRDTLNAQYGFALKPVTCDACNSSMTFADNANCHTGRFLCELTNNALEGRCAEVMSMDELMGCFESQVQYSCDCHCPTIDACGPSASAGSYDCACCDCKQSGNKTPRPVCDKASTNTSAITSPSTPDGSLEHAGLALLPLLPSVDLRAFKPLPMRGAQSGMVR